MPNIDERPTPPCVGGKLIRKNHKCNLPDIAMNAIQEYDRYHCDCGYMYVYHWQYMIKGGEAKIVFDWILQSR